MFKKKKKKKLQESIKVIGEFAVGAVTRRSWGGSRPGAGVCHSV